MSVLGAHLSLWIGPTAPAPASPTLLEALESVEVTHTDEGRSGFQLSFRVGRSRMDAVDYSALLMPTLRPFARVLLLVTFNAVPEVLMDGVITHQQLDPGIGPGTSLLTVTGEDVSVMMDLEERSAEHPAQPEYLIATKIIATYAQYGLIPTVIPPPSLDIPLPTERIPVQQATDLEYLGEMAERFAYVFYVTPGPAPLTNMAYWGPPVRVGIPQRALSTNLGPNSNVTSINFQYDGLASTLIEGNIQDRQTGQELPVRTMASTRPPLSSRPAWATQSHRRTRQLRATGLNTVQAFSRAQAETDRSNDQVLHATGELDASRYEALLKPRGLVGLRGAGLTYDGLYYVQSVSHRLRKGDYRQQFTLTREGQGSITPLVIP